MTPHIRVFMISLFLWLRWTGCGVQRRSKKRESTTNNHSPTIMNAPAAPPTNANLIVDFPATRRMQGINHAEVARHVHMRHVQFASEIQGRFIRYPSCAENKAKWYDEEDYRRFGSTMLRDAMKASAKVAAARVDHGTGTATNAKLILSCVGLHHLISRDVPARNRAVRERVQDDTCSDCLDGTEASKALLHWWSCRIGKCCY